MCTLANNKTGPFIFGIQLMPRHVLKKIANTEIHWIVPTIYSRELNKSYGEMAYSWFSLTALYV